MKTNKHIKKILIDNREQKRIQYAKEYYKSYKPIVTQLEEGDYLFIGENNTGVCFEYKTGADFINSISNNHLFNQIYYQSQKYQYQFIIIQSYNLETELKKHEYTTGIETTHEQINGAIASLNLNTTILYAQTQEQAFDLMHRQAIKIIENKPQTYKYKKKHTNTALNYLTSQSRIGLETATNICKTLNIHTLQDLLNLNQEQLQTVPAVGEKTATRILKSIKKDGGVK